MWKLEIYLPQVFVSESEQNIFISIWGSQDLRCVVLEKAICEDLDLHVAIFVKSIKNSRTYVSIWIDTTIFHTLKNMWWTVCQNYNTSLVIVL